MATKKANVNKTELTEMIKDKTGASKVDTVKFIDTFQNIVIDILKGGTGVTWTGFMIINPKTRAARTGRNPRTGAPIKIPASKTVGFKAGQAFKNILNGKTTPKTPKASKKKPTAKPAGKK